MYRKLALIVALVMVVALVAPVSAWGFNIRNVTTHLLISNDVVVTPGFILESESTDTGNMALYGSNEYHSSSTTNLLATYPGVGGYEIINMPIPDSIFNYRYGWIYIVGGGAGATQFWINTSPSGVYYAPANVTFSASRTGNFTDKLSGVLIVLSNGQSNTTGTDGTAFIPVYPNSSAYTYDASKTGYTPISGQSLGGVGAAGGIEYFTMEPGGDIRQWVMALNGPDGFSAVGSNVMIRDVEANTWSNVTNDADGAHYKDIPINHTVDIYASRTGDTPAARIALPVSLAPYYLTLWPSSYTGTAGAGNVNLIAVITDKNDNKPLEGVSLSITTPTGSTENRITGVSGSEIFIVPNMSVISASASKTGYTPLSQYITTTAFGPDTIRIEMDKITVTTSPTYANGSIVTTQATPDTRTDDQKADDMAESVYGWIEILIPLAGITTILYMFGWKP